MAVTELRVEVEKDELTVLDAYVNATGKSRAGVIDPEPSRIPESL